MAEHAAADDQQRKRQRKQPTRRPWVMGGAQQRDAQHGGADRAEEHAGHEQREEDDVQDVAVVADEHHERAGEPDCREPVPGQGDPPPPALRAAVIALRNDGTISNEVMHRLERELDLEDERLEI